MGIIQGIALCEFCFCAFALFFVGLVHSRCCGSASFQSVLGLCLLLVL